MLTEQDKVNIEFVNKYFEKAGVPKGLRKWVGEHGFNECVAKLSGKRGIDSAKAVCGSLKGKAREAGELKPKHMGRIEKQKYLKRKKTKKS
jgi:hypothetical protein